MAEEKAQLAFRRGGGFDCIARIIDTRAQRTDVAGCHGSQFLPQSFEQIERRVTLLLDARIALPRGVIDATVLQSIEKTDVVIEIVSDMGADAAAEYKRYVAGVIGIADAL